MNNDPNHPDYFYPHTDCRVSPAELAPFALFGVAVIIFGAINALVKWTLHVVAHPAERPLETGLVVVAALVAAYSHGGRCAWLFS